jgi:uncharacterized protein YbaR (Trm112 family)
MASVRKHFTDAEVDITDGLTLTWSDRWFNLRPSNTEPVLRLNVEGPDESTVDGLVSEVRDLLSPSASEPSLIAPELAEILVCPACHGDLRGDLEQSWLVCTDCGLRYPVRDGIPIMLIDEAEQS